MRTNTLEGKTVETASGEVLEIGEEAGSGAEGTVYRIRGCGSHVVKVFNQKKREDDRLEEKIRAMQSPSVFSKDPTWYEKNFRSIIWPTDLVLDGGDFLGYKMPYLDLSQRKDALTYAKDNLKWETSTWDERYKAAINLALSVAVIHRQGHAIGDFNEQNIYIKDGYTALIDCDSYHIKDRPTGNTYEGSTTYKRYCPPGGRGERLREVRNSDKFGLAVHIFQFLMNGYHPFGACGSEITEGDYGDAIEGNAFPYKNPKPGRLEPKPGAPEYTRLPRRIRRLFEKCFIDGKHDPRKRPDAEMWIEALDEARCNSSTSAGEKMKTWSYRAKSWLSSSSESPSLTAQLPPLVRDPLPRLRSSDWIRKASLSSATDETTSRLRWGILNLTATFVYLLAATVIFLGALFGAVLFQQLNGELAVADPVVAVLVFSIVVLVVLWKSYAVAKEYIKHPAVQFWGATGLLLLAIDTLWPLTVICLGVVLYMGMQYWEYIDEANHPWWTVGRPQN